MDTKNLETLYPLKFKPIFKEKIWGGDKIKTVLEKDYSPLTNCGELWAVSGVDGDISVVEEGPLKGNGIKDLINQYKGDLIGQSVYEKFGDTFPLLIKFIDANQDLSIQVHPDDTLAKSRHNSFGKTEMWYIIQADEGSKLITGFNQVVDKDTYLKYFNDGKLEEILNKEAVLPDDVFFIPAGRVHTIGKGLLLAEIQQTSDITYRIYDFDRTDSNGNKRELHTEEALDAIDYGFYDEYKTRYEQGFNKPNKIVECDYFSTSVLEFDQKLDRNLSSIDSFAIYIGLEGTSTMSFDGGSIQIGLGEAVLVPATINNLSFATNSNKSKILETYIP